MTRILLGVAAFISALFAPVWVTIILGVTLAALWDAWEVILLGLLIDLLYLPLSGWMHIPVPTTLAALVLVWAMVPIRRRLFVE